MSFRNAQNLSFRDCNLTEIQGNQYIYNTDHGRLDIRAALNPVDRSGFVPKCMEGTRADIFQQINNWLDDFHAPNILLLTGSPGAGKSAISSTLVSDLGERGRLAASFFFLREQVHRSDPTSVWRTIAFDLIHYDSTLAGSIAEALKERRVDPGSSDIELHFKHLIREPLQRLTTKKPVVLLDALDECGCDSARSSQRRVLLNTLKNWSSLPPEYKLIVTSRDENLPLPFRKVCHGIELRTGDIVTDAANEDIYLFFRIRLAGIAEQYPSLPPTWPGDSTLKKLTARAAGLFIWAETVVRLVEQDVADAQLDVILAGDFGQSVIDSLYQQVLERAFEGPSRRKNPIVKAFRAVIGTILVAKDHLRRADLCHFLGEEVSETMTDKILFKLSSVVMKDGPDDCLHFRHLSFIEFLSNPEQCPQHFLIDRDMRSQVLASSCFHLMNDVKNGLKFNICGLETSHVRNADVDDLPSRIERSIPSHLAYACRFWAAHVGDTPNVQGAQQALIKDIKEFLRVRLLYWLEVMSLIREVSASKAALLSIAHWIGTTNSTLMDFAIDASLFVTHFYFPISESAPHIYLSALPFSPRKSLISKHFQPQFPGVLMVTNQGDNWPALLYVFRGHRFAVNSVGFSPDGKHIVSGCAGGILVLSAESGEIVAGPFQDAGWVTSVGFSPDGKHIVSGSKDGRIQVWDAKSGEVVAGPFKGHRGVTSVAFSPDGKHIVSGSHKTIQMWNAKSGEIAAGLLRCYSGVTSVAFSPDGKQIVSGSHDKTVCIWNAETGKIKVGPFKGHTGWVTSVAFSPDGHCIVSGSDDKTIRVWNVKSGESVADPIKGHIGGVTSVAFSPDGKHIVSGSYDKTIRMWNAKSGEIVAGPFEGHTYGVTSVAFSPAWKHIVSGSYDKTIRMWNIESGGVASGPCRRHAEGIISVGLSPDGKHIVSGSHDKTVCIWNAETGKIKVGPFKGHTGWVTSVAFSPDGHCIVSGSDDKTIRVWNVKSGESVAGPFKGHIGGVTSVVFSPDGKHIVSRSYDKIQMWNAKSGEIVAVPFEATRNSLTSVVFSPDGKHIVSGYYDKTIQMWDVKSGKIIACPFQGHTDQVKSVGFSPDGKHIVSGSSDKTIRIWNVKSGKTVSGPFEGHTNWVTSVRFSPDGKHIVSGSSDKTIWIWNIKSGKTVSGPFEGHTDEVTSVAFSPDGKHIVSSSLDKTVRKWNVGSGQIVAGFLEDYRDGVTSVGFSPGGRQVVSSFDAESVKLWSRESIELWNKGTIESQHVETSDIASEPCEHSTALGLFSHSKHIVSKAHNDVINALGGANLFGTCIHPNSYGWVSIPKQMTRDLAVKRPLLFWVPSASRSELCDAETLCILGPQATHINLSKFVHGVAWTQCHGK